MGEKDKTSRFKIAFLGLLLVASSLVVNSAQAATQYLSPSAGSYSSSGTFSVGVYATSSDQPASAFSAYITFPTDKLNVTSVSKAGSIISMWVQEPAYSNSSGTVSFEGFIPNPGYTGSGGKLVTITFQVMGSGSASVGYSGGSVLANDGLGTNITTGLGGATFTLGPATPTDEDAEPEPAPAAPGVPRAPLVTSSTHPDSAVWYTANDAAFAWSLPSGTRGVNFLANQNANSDPGTQSDGLISSYRYDDVEDGLWYFHIRLQNELGWGGVSHFPFRIDTAPPEAFALTPLGLDPDSGNPVIDFTALDAASGIDRYVISIDGVEMVSLRASELEAGKGMVLAAQTSGLHLVEVAAYDLAGNVQTASLEIDFPKATAAASDGSGAEVATGLVAGLLKLLKIAILTIFLLLILAALVYVGFMIARHAPRHAHRAVVSLSEARPRRLRRTLRKLRHDIHKNLRRLEDARRVRNLPESAERTIRSTSRALSELEDKITRSLNDL